MDTNQKKDLCEQIEKVANKCLWLFHCAMGNAHQSLNDELKLSPRTADE